MTISSILMINKTAVCTCSRFYIDRKSSATGDSSIRQIHQAYKALHFFIHFKNFQIRLWSNPHSKMVLITFLLKNHIFYKLNLS